MRLPYLQTEDEEMLRKSGRVAPLGPEPPQTATVLPPLGAETVIPDLTVDARPDNPMGPPPVVEGAASDAAVENPWKKYADAAANMVQAIPDASTQPVPQQQMMPALPQIPVSMYYQNPYGRKKRPQ